MLNRTALLEAILFTTDEPLSVEKICKIMNLKSNVVNEIIEDLKVKYSSDEHGFHVSELGGYRFTVKDRYINHVSTLTPHSDMSRGLLRVLSIIAYHQPIKQSEIVKVIGNRTYEYTKSLRERGLIKSEKKGRTRIFETTPKFEEYFNINKNEIMKEIRNEKSDINGNKLPDEGNEVSERGENRENIS